MTFLSLLGSTRVISCGNAGDKRHVREKFYIRGAVLLKFIIFLQNLNRK